MNFNGMNPMVIAFAVAVIRIDAVVAWLYVRKR
jgi:hypothetical protein